MPFRRLLSIDENDKSVANEDDYDNEEVAHGRIRIVKKCLYRGCVDLLIPEVTSTTAPNKMVLSTTSSTMPDTTPADKNIDMVPSTITGSSPNEEQQDMSNVKAGTAEYGLKTLFIIIIVILMIVIYSIIFLLRHRAVICRCLA